MKEYSYTEISCAQACPKRYEWAYIKRLSSREKGKALVFGIEAHKGLAGEPVDPNVGITLPYSIGQLAAKHFGPVQAPEVRRHAMIDGIVSVNCKCDGLLPDSVVEYKTVGASRCVPANYEALKLSLQNRIACYVFGREYLRLRIIRKSAIRIKKNESEEEFDARYLQEYIDNPGEHFMEIAMKPEPLDLKEIHVLHDCIRHYQDTGVYPRTAPGSCFGIYACDYLPLCSDYETNKHLYDVRKEKEENHEEE